MSFCVLVYVCVINWSRKSLIVPEVPFRGCFLSFYSLAGRIEYSPPDAIQDIVVKYNCTHTLYCNWSPMALIVSQIYILDIDSSSLFSHPSLDLSTCRVIGLQALLSNRLTRFYSNHIIPPGTLAFIPS